MNSYIVLFHAVQKFIDRLDSVCILIPDLTVVIGYYWFLSFSFFTLTFYSFPLYYIIWLQVLVALFILIIFFLVYFKFLTFVNMTQNTQYTTHKQQQSQLILRLNNSIKLVHLMFKLINRQQSLAAQLYNTF